jgi:hypothetical protein
MHLKTLSQNFKLISLLSVLACTQACTSLTDAKKLFIKDVVKSTPTSDFIELSKLDLIERKLDKHIEHWNGREGELNRLILLGQDMEFVLKELKEQELQTSNLIEPFSLSKQEMLDNTDVNGSNLVQEVRDLSPTSTVNPALEINPVQPINESLMPSGQSLADNKFSSRTNPRLSQKNTSVAQSTITSPIDNKFSKTANQSAAAEVMSGLQNVKETTQTCQPLSAAALSSSFGKAFAVHLASYKDDKNVKSGATRLRDQFNQELCGKVAVVKPIEVRGTNFLSLRMGPFRQRDNALETCRKISDQGAYCKVTLFDGELVK